MEKSWLLQAASSSPTELRASSTPTIFDDTWEHHVKALFSGCRRPPQPNPLPPALLTKLITSP